MFYKKKQTKEEEEKREENFFDKVERERKEREIENTELLKNCTHTSVKANNEEDYVFCLFCGKRWCVEIKKDNK